MREAIWEGFVLLFRLFIAYAFVAGARRAARESHRPKLQVYLCAIALSGALAWYSWANYGTHIEDADPVFGGGTEMVDFTATDEQRNRHGVAIFTVVSVLTVSGVFFGLGDRENQAATRQNRTSGDS